MAALAPATTWIAGYGQTRFGRQPEAGLTGLAVEAAEASLADAGLGPDRVEGVFLGSFAALALGGQGFPAAVLADRLGLGPVPAFALEGACASGSLAFTRAVAAIEAGELDIALVVGSELMSAHPTTDVTAALARANDIDSESFRAGLTFPGFFALLARAYADRYDVDIELLADVSVKNRDHGARNPMAHFQKPIGRAEASGARPIADPLRLYDCSPVSDGAAALVLTSARSLPEGSSSPVRVIAVGQAAGATSPERMDSFVGLTAAQHAARSAFDAAQVGPDDIDVAEVHDCFSIAEWVALEDLGLFPRGEAAAATASGATRVGGQVAVNTSGGLLAKGHPVGATGVAQLGEIVHQLRGDAHVQVDDAQVGVTHNVGGTGGVAVVAVLGDAR